MSPLAKALQACIDAIDPREGDAERAAWEQAIDALASISKDGDLWSAVYHCYDDAVIAYNEHLDEQSRELDEGEEVDEEQAALDAENLGHLNRVAAFLELKQC